MRVLVADDNPTDADRAAAALASAGIACERAVPGEAAELARLCDFDLVVLDAAPDGGGPDAVRSVREAGLETPILVVSRLDSVELRVRALASGADDCLAKPFHGDELAARVRAIVRRSRGHAGPVIRAGKLTVDIDRRAAAVAGRDLGLTGKEYDVLELLALRKGRTLSKETVLDHLYGGVDEPARKIVDVFVCKLRKKLASADAARCIGTVRGRGYRLVEPAAV